MEWELVWTRFLQLSGLENENAAPWQDTCRDTLAELSAKVRPGAVGGENLLCAACAALAFYRYSLVQAAEPETGFSAGEIKVTRGTGGVLVAEKLWHQAYAAAAPYLRDDGFCFWQVKA